MSRVRTLVLWTTGIVVVALVAALGAGWWTVRRSWPEASGTIELEVLDEPVEVVRDDHGIPHVFASTFEDLFRAQGYVHAQDRFWEMDFRRHVTAGRLAELFGESQLETDRFIRTLGWRRVAEQEIELLTDETRRMLEAYAAGVNAWMRDRPTAEMSLEYAVLGLQRSGYQPEPWTPADSVAWLKAMAWDLRSNLEDEVWRAQVAAEVGVTRTNELYPPYPHDRHPVIVENGAVADGAFDPSASPTAADTMAAGRQATVLAGAAEPLERVASRLEALPRLLGEPGRGIGSNSWVVSGDHTASGAPLLANDPHLGPSIPSVWHQMQLRCRPVSEDCPVSAAGYTFSGLPGVVIGHNERIAWGFTNLGPDVTDLFLEKVAGDEYEFEGEMLPLETITETIEVAGGSDVTHTVRLTRHGPILSDVSDTYAEVAADAPAGGEVEEDLAVALRWTALDPGGTMNAILPLNTADDFAEFREAAALFDVPSQNLVYADVDGHIGYQAPGRIPIRESGDGRYPVPGWTGEHEWVGTIPFDELPWVLDPEDGMIVTANQRVVGPDYANFLGADADYGFRADRLAERLEELGSEMTVEHFTDLQLDSRNMNAEFLVPLLLEVDVPEETESAQSLLASWDLDQGRDSAGAAFFNALWRHVILIGFEDELPPTVEQGVGDRAYETVRTLPPDSPWWDDVDTDEIETREDVFRRALVAAGKELTERLGEDVTGWRWGDLHTLTLVNESFGTSGIAPIEWLFNRGPVATAGGTDAVNATAWQGVDGYDVDWVPSMRMVVDLADLDESRWINLTGASGHAFHPHYYDQTTDWADGRTLPMRWREQRIRNEGVDVLHLAPETEE